MAIDIDDLERFLENENLAENAANKKVVGLHINNNLLSVLVIRQLILANATLNAIRIAVEDD